MGKQSVRLLAIVVAAAAVVEAGVVSTKTLEELVKDADTIVVADIIEGTIVDRTASATLRVVETLKGDIDPGSAIPFEWMQPGGYPFPQAVSLERDRGLFFFRRDAGGNWIVIPPMNGDIQLDGVYFYVSRSGPIAGLPAGATLEEKIFAEITTSKMHGKPPIRGAAFDLAKMFSGVQSEFIKETFRRFANSESLNLRATGLKALLRQSDAAALAKVEATQAELQNLPWGSDVTDAIKYRFSNTDVAVVRRLGKLATNKDTVPELRVAAGGALARLHTKEALPYLAKMLDSPNITMRTYAVGGLAMFANNVPVGGHEPAAGEWPYRTEGTIRHSVMSERAVAENEAFYVGFWKDWWSEHRGDLEQR